MVYLGMSTEQLSKKNTNHLIVDTEDISLELDNITPKKIKKVDINLLMDKVREEKKRRERKSNIYKFNCISSISYWSYCIVLIKILIFVNSSSIK